MRVFSHRAKQSSLAQNNGGIMNRFQAYEYEELYGPLFGAAAAVESRRAAIRRNQAQRRLQRRRNRRAPGARPYPEREAVARNDAPGYIDGRAFAGEVARRCIIDDHGDGRLYARTWRNTGYSYARVVAAAMEQARQFLASLHAAAMLAQALHMAGKA